MGESSEALQTTLALDIIHSLQDGLVACDAEFRIVAVNPAAERLLDMKEPELLGRLQWEVFPDILGTQLEAGCRRAMADRVPVTFEHLCGRGQRRCEVQVSPCREGGLVARIREIADGERPEEAVHNPAAFPSGIRFRC